jgi:uncharacterized integral membrane protein
MSERGWRWLGLALIAILAGVFGFLNAGERVAVNLGPFVLYQLPLVPLLFVAFLLGMVTMFLASLHHDVQLRRELRARGLLEPPAPPPQPPAPPRPEAPTRPLPEPEPPPGEPM